jgi:hypothetical protein
VEGGKWAKVDAPVGEQLEPYDNTVTVDEGATATFTEDYTEGYNDGYSAGVATGGTDITIEKLNEILDERIGDIEIALDEIIALQEYYTGATFDDLHAYATDLKGGGE